jgi:hypothetical protein
MTKRKTTATGLAKTSGQDGKLPGALRVGYANLFTDLKAHRRYKVLVTASNAQAWYGFHGFR